MCEIKLCRIAVMRNREWKIKHIYVTFISSNLTVKRLWLIIRRQNNCIIISLLIHVSIYFVIYFTQTSTFILLRFHRCFYSNINEGLQTSSGSLVLICITENISYDLQLKNKWKINSSMRFNKTVKYSFV